MLLKTRDFGEIEVAAEEIVSFEGRIYGFEDYREFVFLFEESVGEGIVWLQSTEEPELCFVLIDPREVVSDYNFELPGNIGEILGEGSLEVWLVAVIKEKFENSTVNLKSPVLVNTGTMRAAQIILEENYPVKHPLRAEPEKNTFGKSAV